MEKFKKFRQARALAPGRERARVQKSVRLCDPRTEGAARLIRIFIRILILMDYVWSRMEYLLIVFVS